LFSTGSPDSVTVAYVENVEVTEVQDTIKDCNESGFSNPSGNKVFIINPECFTNYLIYDISGRLQLSGLIDAEYVDVQRLRPGLYIISLYGQKNERAVVGKLVIVR